LKPGLDQARKEIDGLATSEEDVLSYALFPEISRDYFLARDGRRAKHEGTVSATSSNV
jgi:pyruvate/oxaloacetate carboxyltransferase